MTTDRVALTAGAQRSRTSTLSTQWRLHAAFAVAFYDHLACTEGSVVRLIVWLQPLRCHKPDATN